MEIPRHWRLKDFRYSLKGWKYTCGAIEIIPRPIHREQKVNLPADGTIFSSKLPSYTSGSCTVKQEQELQSQEQ